MQWHQAIEFNPAYSMRLASETGTDNIHLSSLLFSFHPTLFNLSCCSRFRDEGVPITGALRAMRLGTLANTSYIRER